MEPAPKTFEQLQLEHTSQKSTVNPTQSQQRTNFSNKASGSTRNGICRRFLHEQRCPDEDQCKFSHDLKKARTCHMILQTGTCSKGYECDYSHSYQSNPKPNICKSFSTTRKCHRGEQCPYSHMLYPCRAYEIGFCVYGENSFICKNCHVQKKLCENYMLGFCPLGPECPEAHPKLLTKFDEAFLKTKINNVIKCFNSECSYLGHKTPDCYLRRQVDPDVPMYCFQCNKTHSKKESTCNIIKQPPDSKIN